jgi:hypothetical protein
MTQKNFRFELAHGRNSKANFHFKMPHEKRAISGIFPLFSGFCRAVCHSIRRKANSLFPDMNSTPLAHLLAASGNHWQSSLLHPKKGEKKSQDRLVALFRFLSLSCAAEKNSDGSLFWAAIFPQMAYSLTPFFLTLQNEAL